jgi:signal transduction histidine kinase
MNAIKYTPDGRWIVISGRSVEETPEMPEIEIVVGDSGIGIALEHQELIFEKFFQIGEVHYHSSGKTKFRGGGPGLGLAIARGIVEAHKGRIWVESPGYDEVNNPGSKFFVRLPVNGVEK